MVSIEEKKSKLYRRLATIVYSTMPDDAKLRAIKEVLDDEKEEDEEKVSSLDWE